MVKSQSCTEWYRIVHNGTESYRNIQIVHFRTEIVRSGTESYRIVLSGTVSYRVVRSGTVSYRNIRNNTRSLQSFWELYSDVQEYTE